MHLAGGGAAAFAGAMAFSDDGCPLGPYGEADPGNVNGEECALVFTGQDTAGFVVSRLQPSKPKIRLASEMAYQPSR